MKKFLLPLILLAALLLLAGCSSTTTSTTTDTTTTDEGTTSTTTTTTDSTGTTSSTSSTNSDLIGEWTFEGLVDNKNYDIALDLERNNRFSLEVDEENSTEALEAEAEGTYVVNGDTITLSIETVRNDSGYFTGEVVQNGQVDLKYTQNNNVLTITNISNTISFLSDDLQLYKDY